MTTGTFKIPTRIRRGYTLMLRTCTGEDDGRLTAHGGFFWPALGPVECPDWKPVAECGNGLHGFLRGCGNHNLANWTDRAVWLVVEVKTSEIVSLEGKIKVPRGRVIYSGERLQALETMARLGHLDNGHMGGTATAGDRGTATAGDRGTATAGDRGTATAGYGGTATAGYGGTATAGNSGTATAGDRGTATAGNSGTATAGDRGTATAGDDGTATAGNRGTATAGYGGTAAAGNGGTLQIKWRDRNRYCISTAYVDEDGITAGTKYQLDGVGKFIVAEISK